MTRRIAQVIPPVGGVSGPMTGHRESTPQEPPSQQNARRHAAHLRWKDLIGSGSRPVVWSPRFDKWVDKVVLHPDLGEGLLVEEKGEQLIVKFADGVPVSLDRRFVFRPSDIENYEKIIKGRLDRFSHLPYCFVPFAMRSYLGKEEVSELQGRVYTVAIAVDQARLSGQTLTLEDVQQLEVTHYPLTPLSTTRAKDALLCAAPKLDPIHSDINNCV